MGISENKRRVQQYYFLCFITSAYIVLSANGAIDIDHSVLQILMFHFF